ncbi:single-stranded DNA-binding protein [Ihubacter sp. mB4P-1]|uniref:single-stranded DNA-binding protein n=1 Tax=Ihubacter sp. mB4P-1 TaxID=3242370 RepID=UPI003C7DA642
MNRTEHIGYLTKNVELKKDRNGGDIARLRIAVNRGRSRDGGDLGADYLNITVFGSQAMACYECLEKGSRIGVSGHLRSGSYVSRKTGIKIETVEIVAEKVEFLSYKKNAAAEVESETEDVGVEDFIEYSEDETLPFDIDAATEEQSE